ncbi:MAG: histidine ammonia-lyase [Candidatus Zambryskibacteria bacterium RIFCSPHIGHO2_01_FULL_43_27]|nr:MAG: histidine ammonia-lyase [Candidatus Zambryskibacteria bacterium RIFCSPHIGHO2_01_FULL_43_27]OHA99562.1 MAG: histidine ammonia-lyase [Candidatus Zambryskibacteria bacterium RIFCSPHIGHO2_12_FULL_43_12b]
MARGILEIGPDHHLSFQQVDDVSKGFYKIKLSIVAKRKIKRSREVIEKMLNERRVVYGVTTGFGNFKDKMISPEDVEELQRNLIRSHASGVGELFSNEQVRAAMLVRLNSLVQGYSGVRLELLELLCNLINKNVTPAVPSQGSVGSSGDLAPLSHIGLVLMGEGKAFYKDKLISGRDALKRVGLKPISLAAKEGLAFNNGTSVMTGIAALILLRSKKIIELADIACALTLEAVCGVSSAYDERIHKLRPHPGQMTVAKNILNFVSQSRLVNSVPDRIQDSYSLRCSPQVHGAIRDAYSYVEDVLDKEINSVTDNPLIFPNQNEALSGGNFHGEPIAISFDTLGIALSELANISERRTAKLVDPSTSNGLPPFLVPLKNGGLHSGFMIPQYTAAALVSENKVLAHPASVDSIPTSANQEDHVSMGTIAVRKSLKILENVENVLAIEILSACQAIDFRNPNHLGKTTKEIYKFVRKNVTFMARDREVATDIAKVRTLLPQIYNKVDRILN